MRYNEPTQSGNPYKLTINQHIFPMASIERFSKSNGKVNVYLIDKKRSVFLKPSDQIFLAKRVWSHAAEKGFMKIAEDNFQKLIDGILTNGLSVIIDSNQNKIISKFYALCCLRFEESKEHPQEIKFNNFSNELVLTKNEEEILESNGTYFINENILSNRNRASLHIQILYSRYCHPETTWSLVYSRNIQFIVPDSFVDIGVVPLTPNYCLIANQKNSEITPDNAVRINKLAIKNHRNFTMHVIYLCVVLTCSNSDF